MNRMQTLRHIASNILLRAESTDFVAALIAAAVLSTLNDATVS